MASGVSGDGLAHPWRRFEWMVEHGIFPDGDLGTGTEIQMENPSRCRFRGGPNGPVPRCAGALQRVASICNAATPSAKSRDFGLKVPSMRLDLVHPAAERVVLVLEGIGDDKVLV